MNEIILDLAALVLALFCLTEYVRERRDPLPKGPGAMLRDRRAVYIAALGALVISAAASAARGLGLRLGAPAGLLRVLGILSGVFQLVHALAFVLYLANLFRSDRSGGARKKDRTAALLLAAVMLAGAAIQEIWSVPVLCFFEAVALFGCAALLERDGTDSADRRFYSGVTLVIALTLLACVVMNVTTILKLSNAQSEELGNTQLDVIRSDLQETITDAEYDVLRVAMGAEQLLESGASRETLTEYFYGQRQKHLSSASFMNVYISGRDWIIVPEFDIPADFHPAERVW